MTTSLPRVRVLVVDDSMLMREILISGLSASPRIEVVGYAVNAMDAKQKIAHLNPDVLTLDVEMPGMSGIDFLKTLGNNHPPVIMVSSLNLRVFDALAVGAMDFVRKPDASQSKADFIRTLGQKILIAHSSQRRKPSAAITTTLQAASLLGVSAVLDQTIIGLGASTGGTEATLRVMQQLPADIPGMVIVQHMPAGFTKMYADRLNQLCSMEVREAKHGDEIRRGLALVAPADYQSRVMRQGTKYLLSCKPEPKVSGHCPSVDVLFSSMAETIKSHMAGIIMTGMGRDGASGLLSMRQAGAYTIGQDQESSVVYGMPMVAHQIGAVQTQASLDNIAGLLLRHLKSLQA
ncbi:MAG: response regulator receiver modulated CheB methylesterase [Firmicutes bacterium]|nr:response regulator receiver modulated CheB methylesterase [Bacillota bacterium]